MEFSTKWVGGFQSTDSRLIKHRLKTLKITQQAQARVLGSCNQHLTASFNASINFKIQLQDPNSNLDIPLPGLPVDFKILLPTLKLNFNIKLEL